MRSDIFRSVANSKLSGIIFTFVWAIDDLNDQKQVDNYLKIFHEQNKPTYLIELEATQEIRVVRNKTELRLKEKPSKRNLVSSEKNLIGLDEKYQLNSTKNDTFFNKYDNYLKINNSNKSAEAVAIEIKRHFQAILVNKS